ncbi:hypothetical protein DAI22_05g110001 [Oryza sativa Japonica Group]|nr:hypothetical protein DAI22_05g110001 [Oryza sativa Japonica Group]
MTNLQFPTTCPGEQKKGQRGVSILFSYPQLGNSSTTTAHAPQPRLARDLVPATGGASPSSASRRRLPPSRHVRRAAVAPPASFAPRRAADLGLLAACLHFSLAAVHATHPHLHLGSARGAASGIAALSLATCGDYGYSISRRQL